uniref:Uncharacterized protein n=1 Tax=Echeneis naucrates TaxID=173247 RepID=A0A665WJN7_ECHNA
MFITLVYVLDGEAATQDLHEDVPELLGGQVIKEWVDDRCDVALEEETSPLGFWYSCHHETTNLVGKPAHSRQKSSRTQDCLSDC